MSDKPVTVRMYNVGFGDCFLVTLPDGKRDRKVLIDCGRHSGTLQDDPPFWTVVDELIADLKETDGVARIDVLVVSHRHRDHVHGFSKPALWEAVEIGEIWMPWTEAPDDPVARTLRLRQDRVATRAFHALRAFGAADSAGAVGIARNSLTNARAMATLRGFGCPIRYLPEPLQPLSTVLRGEGERIGLPHGVTVHVLGPSRDPQVIRALDPPQGAAYLRLLPSDAFDLDDPDGAGAPDPTSPRQLWQAQWDLGDPAAYLERVRASCGVSPICPSTTASARRTCSRTWTALRWPMRRIWPTPSTVQ